MKSTMEKRYTWVEVSTKIDIIVGKSLNPNSATEDSVSQHHLVRSPWQDSFLWHSRWDLPLMGCSRSLPGALLEGNSGKGG